MSEASPRSLLAVLAFVGATLCAAQAEDWPTFRHDNRRSGVTDEKVSLPLSEAWVRRSPTPPMTAWAGPAKWDAFSGNDGLQSMRNFDPAFFVTAAGDSVFFGSSVDHAVHCLDVATGDERWVAFAGGAVRLPPAIGGGRAYFGADDGFAYCVDATTGKPVWKFRPAKSPRLIPSDGKLISPWPVRTGVLLDGGRALFGASLLPWETSYLCALDAVSGETKFVTEHGGVTMQGAMLAASDSLYVPQGRSAPLRYALADGAGGKAVGGAGGTFCLLTEDERLIAMPQNQKSADNVIQIADPSGKASMLRFGGADRLVVDGAMAYIHQRGKLRAFDRVAYGKANDESVRASAVVRDAKKKIGALRKRGGEGVAEEVAELETLIKEEGAKRAAAEKDLPKANRWEVEAPAPFDLIMAGGILYVGGDGGVAAFDAKSGRGEWSTAVEGKAYGLAIAGGRLFVSTSLGHIYCFGSGR